MKVQDIGNALQVTIDGEEYRNLQRVADAMNATEWMEGNSPTTLCRGWIMDLVDEELNNPRTLALSILDAVATDDEGLTDAPEPLRSNRLAELRASFVAAGILEK